MSDDHRSGEKLIATMVIDRIKQESGHNGLSPEGFRQFSNTVEALLVGLLARVSYLTLENERLRAQK